MMLLAPTVGHWTDAHGRKPFIALACFVSVRAHSLAAAHAEPRMLRFVRKLTPPVSEQAPPVICLVLYMRYGLSLMWYFPATVSLRYRFAHEHVLSTMRTLADQATSGLGFMCMGCSPT